MQDRASTPAPSTDNSWSAWYKWLVGQSPSASEANSADNLASPASRPRASSDSDWTVVPARNRTYEQMLADEAYAKELYEREERERRDEELARKLYEEEQQRTASGGGGDDADGHRAAALTDEEIARRLQEEEEAAAAKQRQQRDALRSSAPPSAVASSHYVVRGRPPAVQAFSAAPAPAADDRMERLVRLMQLLHAASQQGGGVLGDSHARPISSLLRRDDAEAGEEDFIPQRPIIMRSGPGNFRNRVDLNNYEQLSSLPVVPRSGVSAQSLSQLPTRVYAPGGANAEKDCPICLTSYAAGETLRTLPCLHSFHRDCIDTWLKEHTQCPICKHPVQT